MANQGEAESPERSESAEQLWNILSSLNPRNCTFHIVRTALKHLQLELVPNIVSGEHEHPVYKANGHRALPCLGMLSVIAETCREKPSLNQALIGVLTSDYVDGICMWINFCLHFGLSFPQDMTPGEDFRKAYLIHAQLLCDLLDTSPEATLLFLSSSSFFDLLLRIWMTEGKAGEVFMDLEGRCPILLLMMKVLQNHSEEGPPMLAHRIMARPPYFTTHFAERFVRRAHQASEKATTPVLLGKAVGYLDGLMSATGILLKESHQLIGGFRRVDYLGEYSAVLNALSTQAAEEDRSLLFPGMFRLVTSAFKLVLHQESRAVHNYKELFAGGFIESVLRVILAIPSTDKTTTGLALNYLQILGFYTVYPCVLETMLGVEYPVELRECLERTGSPAIKRAWQDFCVAQHEAGRVLDQMENRRGLCDNSSCKRVGNPRATKCSYCSSVVYCSSKCQREDWNKYHREECKRAHLVHSRRKSSHALYSHSSRAFHVAFLEDVYNAQASRLPQSYQKDCPGLGFHQVIPVVNCQSAILSITFEPLVASGGSDGSDPDTDARTCWNRRQVHFAQTYLEPRYLALVEDCRYKRKGTRSTRLVEGVFPLGDNSIIFLTVGLERVNQKWEGVYSIARYGLQVPKRRDKS
ncbi:hypothetical protein DFP72DRAFT_898857 [Ephemerocybe angulata]|uniref:MYND-type domain-containing protein n=1 Tax=Ephemerocybe angulata TaxID=980116 RepID=A0A8H6HYY8_9AGAR|nr:hypothetical protein DFP72DRAFT_898857 [Tulosesus angulatus]